MTHPTVAPGAQPSGSPQRKSAALAAPHSGAPPDAADPSFPIVALLASAGGVDALSRVLAALPANLPAAVLVVLHQAQTRASVLVGILGRRTELTVAEARQDTVLRPGLVLVTPPGRHLLVTPAGRVSLVDSYHSPRPRPSGDLLLATLAVACGPRVLAVVLTGQGFDGHAGVQAVHQHGGTVFAQDEATSKYFDMPAAAITTGGVQQILGLDDIAAAIVERTSVRPSTADPGGPVEAQPVGNG
jgi:two-component system, chemotaxis family, protein-glutamate methylesterase/glutaminase